MAIGELWPLVRAYWVSEERLTAWSLLAAVVGLTPGTVYIYYRLQLTDGGSDDPDQPIAEDPRLLLPLF